MSMPALAVHAHFYQPDRSEPHSGRVPREHEAAPYRDFNRKITAECYRPNAELGNFERLSFDLGPTLAGWLERAEPEVWARIRGSEQRHRALHGTGNALAQGYHHTILPLATREDKELQVAWGIADYEHRFGHRPRGFWLPETAADLETLAVLADHGIEFTLLAPWQAADEAALDVSLPHRVSLPGDRSIAVAFFHRELSAALSFDPETTADADRFAARLADTMAQCSRREGQLLLLASDGELYGHHRLFRDLFLARLLDGATEQAGFELSTPERFLAAHPPRGTVGLAPVGSWSCHHGIDRWRTTCPCTPLATWKAPLRAAVDRVAERLDAVYLDHAERWVADPRRLRRRWIEVLLGQRSADAVLAEEARRSLTGASRAGLLHLLVAQVQRQRMFTSCGWFFADAEGLEPGYVLSATAAAITWTRAVTGEDAEPVALEQLDRDAAYPLADRLRGALTAADEMVRL